MLNGIGGRTVAEAKANITYEEYLSWIAYKNQTGSLNLGLRVERAGALTAWAMRGGKFEDYLPQRNELSDEELLKKAMAEWH